METEPRESTDLLKSNKNSKINILRLEPSPSSAQNEVIPGPPDGGFRAYSVMIGSFLTNGFICGIINSYSLIYNILQKQLQDANETNSESRAALVGALTMGTTFFLSPVSGALTTFLGLRPTAVLGGCIATTSLIISSFLVNYVDALFFTHGIMYGLGASFGFTPSLAILCHYFKRYLGIVNGIVTLGSCVFTVILPPLLEILIKSYGLPGMFRFLAIINFFVALCGLLFKPTPLMILEKTTMKSDGLKSLLKNIVSVEIWKNKRYRVWALSMPIALIGYFVPYVHIKKYIKLNFPSSNDNLPLQSIAVTSGLGRLTFGYLADKPGMDIIMLQQISFFVIGTLTIILPFVPSFFLVVIISLGMGFFDGAFISLIGPIAYILCGEMYAAQGIGCMFGLASIPLTVGPSIAGYLVSLRNSYTMPFVFAGITPIIGATLMFLVRLHKQDLSQTKEVNVNGHTSIPSKDSGKRPASLHSSNGNITS